MSLIKIGTSGYNYKDWANGVFYPSRLSQKKWLEFYCRHFDATELNVTFYRLPKKKIFSNWYDRTPKDFHFAVKGSRFITHTKKLKDCGDSLKLFFKESKGLKDKLKVILWQLPPFLKSDIKKLEAFCELLAKICTRNIKHVFEFRQESWFNKDLYKLLENFNYALCVADSPEWPSVKKITSDFVYLRFHGGKKLYGSQYAEKELKKWAGDIKDWHKQKKDIYIFFNNDMHGYAVQNARQLKEILKGKI